VMSASVERTFPTDLGFTVRMAPGSGDVTLDFPLLNRGDEAFFSVYVFNSQIERPTLAGRIVDVPQLIYSETNVSESRRNRWPFQSHATRAVVRWVLVVIYCGLTLVFLGICVSAIVSFATYLPWKHRWKHVYDEVVEELSKSSPREAETGARPDGVVTAPRVFPEEALRLAAMRGHLLLYDDGLVKELTKKGIPPHPNPMVESFGGLTGLSALMLSLAAVCSTTALVVYTATQGVVERKTTIPILSNYLFEA